MPGTTRRLVAAYLVTIVVVAIVMAVD